MALVRKATIRDVDGMFSLITDYSRKELLLPRSKADLFEHIRDFFVAEEGGKIVGCCALHIFWEDLAEVRSLAVREELQGKGVGRELVERCLEEARALGLRKVFALTYVPDFFLRLGFKEIDKHALPRKIWTDCVNCPYFPDCEEQAVIINLEEVDHG